MSGRYTVKHHGHLRIVAHLFSVLFASLDVHVRVGFAYGHRFFGQTAEGSGDAAGYLLGVDVADQYEHHVFGYVPGVIEFDKLAQLRVLQMFGQADDVARVGVSFECLAHEKAADSLIGIVLCAVVLFVHVLQFGLERTEHRMDEAL